MQGELPDDEVVDSVTVIDEFVSKCWLIALIELDSVDELLLLHFPSDNDGDDGLCVDEDVLDDDELVELLQLFKQMKERWWSLGFALVHSYQFEWNHIHLLCIGVITKAIAISRGTIWGSCWNTSFQVLA